MATPLKMPQPGQMTEECTVLRWYKAVGDTIAKGDVLYEIETDKSNMDVESFDTGTLLAIVADEGATVPVDAIVAWIGAPGEAVPDEALPDGALPDEAVPDGATSAPGDSPALPASQVGDYDEQSAMREVRRRQPRSAPLRHPVNPLRPLVKSMTTRPRRSDADQSPTGIGSRAESPRAESDGAEAETADHATEQSGQPAPRAVQSARVLDVSLWSSGVDLSTVDGSGPGGRIVERDVRECCIRRRRRQSTASGTAVGVR